jgi:uncharacterized membrane protein
MRITIGPSELIAYLLWLGVGIASLIDYRANAHIAGLAAILLAMIACTIHVRTGQVRVTERIGRMIAAADSGSGVTDLRRTR